MEPSGTSSELKRSGSEEGSTVSCVSLKSDRSRGHPPVFSNEPFQKNSELKRSGSEEGSTVSCVSLKSDRSRGHPPVFSNEPFQKNSELKRSGSEEGSTVSCVSLKSDRSRGHPPVFSNEPFQKNSELKRSGSEEGSTVSCVSLKSDRSRGHPPVFSNEPFQKNSELKRSGSEEGSTVSCVSLKSDRSRGHPPVFSNEPFQKKDNPTPSMEQNPDMLKVFEMKTIDYLKQALEEHKKTLSETQQGLLQEEEDAQAEDKTKEAALTIALHILRNMHKDEQAHLLEQKHYGVTTLYQKKLKSFLKEKCKFLFENMEKSPVPLMKIYTKLYLIEGDTAEVNREHEIRQIEAAFNKQKRSEVLIRCEDVFKSLPIQQDKPIRTVLTKGIAGIGKTVLSQKFILDWSEEKANQDIQLLFSLPFRELNLLKNKTRSLMELLCEFYPGLKESGISDLNKCKVLVVLDGLDECRLPLDFKQTESFDISQPASVDVLLTNLIAGKLLPRAHLWITTRPAAASSIPGRFIDRLTEIRGFNNPQKEQYFHKKIDDETLAKRVIANIKSTRSLYIMCHVPVFCWISSIVLGKICAEVGGKMPKTLTQMYIHFVAHQTAQSQVKYAREQQPDSQGNNKMIMSLGKLAFEQLEKGHLIFYEEDLRECDIDVKEASVYSGVCTQVFREESCMQSKVYCFVHLSVQEFLAALYVHVVFTVRGENLINKERIEHEPISELHKAAVDKALESENGHLDLFLRFLLGLSLESSQVLLKGLNIQVKTWDSQSHEETIQHIKKRIDLSEPERYINLLHCLNELNDHTSVDEVQGHLDSGRPIETGDWSTAQWANLVFLLLTSPERSEEIQLKKYSRTKEGFQRLLPAIKASKSAMLNDCNLTADCCQALSSTLSSSFNELNSLNLSDNRLEDSGIKHLCTGLQSPNCRLKMLRLNRCDLTPMSCKDLASVLSCPASGLRELDLSHNDIKDSGVELLSKGLGNTSCRLETLRLSFCSITEKGCEFLASAVKSNPSHLSQLDLSYNHLKDSGVKIIHDALDEGRCELTRLRVDHNAEQWFTPGLSKHTCKLTMDLNTAHKRIIFSDNNQSICQSSEEQPYPDHPDRFDFWAQVMCKEPLQGRCYWEVEWDGIWVGVGLAYKDMKHKGQDNDCLIGYNEKSWSLHCSRKGYRAYHNFESIVVGVPLGDLRRLAVYLDWEAGMLSFYRVSQQGSLTHLHTFFTKFTEPLYPVLRVWCNDSSLKLC